MNIISIKHMFKVRIEWRRYLIYKEGTHINEEVIMVDFFVA